MDDLFAFDCANIELSTLLVRKFVLGQSVGSGWLQSARAAIFGLGAM